MLLYLLLCVISILAGRGILRLTGIQMHSRLSLYLSPIITLTFLTVFLGWGVLFGYTIKQIWATGYLITCLFAVIGIWRADYRFLKDEYVLPATVIILPVGLMAPYFWHGIATYPGSPAMDGWSYIAVGQYLWEYPRGAEGGLAPLYQYAAHLNGTRFIASAFLGFFSPVIGHAGDTQAASGYFLAWALFVFSSTCMFFILTRELDRVLQIAYIGICIFSGWILNMLKVNNYDNALALSFLPAYGGIIFIAEARRWGWVLILAMLSAAIMFCYPEMSPLVFTGVLLFLLQRFIKEKKGIIHWLVLLLMTIAVTSVLVSPWWKTFISFFHTQLGAVVSAQSARPGEGFFPDLLKPDRFLRAFWGFRVWFGNVPAFAFSIFAIFGLYNIFKKGEWGLGFIILLLFCGTMIMVLRSTYDYGAYKFILLNWWGIAFAVISGTISLLGSSKKSIYKWIVGAIFAIFFILNSGSVLKFDKLVSPKSLLEYKQAREITKIVKNEPVVVNVSDDIANIWSVYFLRDIPIHLTEYHGYMAQAHVVPLMERSKSIDVLQSRFLLSDSSSLAQTPSMRLAWAGGPYRLWEISGYSWVVVSRIDNPNGIEKWGGVQGFWIGKGDTRIYLTASRNGKAVISAELVRGPSIPEKTERTLVITTDHGYEKLVTVSGAGIYSFSIPVVGKTTVIIRSPDKPSVSRMPNGDTRPMIVGMRGLEVHMSRE